MALVTTASPYQPYQPDKGDQGPRAPYNAAAKFREVYRLPVEPPPDLRIAHVAYDRDHTVPADPHAYLPLARLQEAVAAGRIGGLPSHVYGTPTTRSQRHVMEVDAPAILGWCRKDGVDAAVLSAIRPVCHQTVSLVARHLEARGIPTVVLGCAKDVVEHVGVPRFVFSDFPLGNPCGKPFDLSMQRAILGMALDLLESARAPRTTVQTPFVWDHDPAWKEDYLNPARGESRSSGKPLR